MPIGAVALTNSSFETTRPKILPTTASTEMFGEIILCQFPFTSGALSKIRPALILFELQEDVVICRITSAEPRGQLDVKLVDWEGAGLLRPSVARIDRIVTAERTVFIRPLGVLSPRDLQSVRAVWNANMRL